MFMRDAGKLIDSITDTLTTYGHVYAYSRASGLDPWEASQVAQGQAKGTPNEVLQFLRASIDRMIENR